MALNDPQATDPNAYFPNQEGYGANTEGGGGGSTSTTTTTTTTTPTSTPSTSKPSTTPSSKSSFPWGKALLALGAVAAAYFVGTSFFGGKR
jgi:hypothetical protein